MKPPHLFLTLSVRDLLPPPKGGAIASGNMVRSFSNSVSRYDSQGMGFIGMVD